jgi:hypothetical protein
VVLVSGSSGIDERAKSAGAAIVMHKSFLPGELLPIIEKVLSARDRSGR